MNLTGSNLTSLLSFLMFLSKNVHKCSSSLWTVSYYSVFKTILLPVPGETLALHSAKNILLTSLEQMSWSGWSLQVPSNLRCFKSLVKQLTSSIVWLFRSSMPWELLHEKKLFFVGAFFLFGLSFHSPSNVKPNWPSLLLNNNFPHLPPVTCQPQPLKR